MSRMTATWTALSLLGISAVHGLENKVVGDDTWNYENHGDDWTMGNCGVTTSPQSPIAFSDDGSAPKEWGLDFSMLTAWSVPEEISADNHGITNYVYQIKATDENLGAFYATEPYSAVQQIYWVVDSIRIHTPAEHSIYGTTYDLEMQIVAEDVQKRADSCKSYMGIFSLFFTVDDDQEESPFWSWVG